MCKISIIAPVFNMEQYIFDFLESITIQDYHDFELLLIDDGSSDSSPEIIDRYAKGHEFCKVIHQENKGVCDARNAGINIAEGEYLYIVDTDDWLDKDALTNISTAIATTNADVIYGTAFVEKGDSVSMEAPFPHSFSSNDPKLIKEIHCALNNNNHVKTFNSAIRSIRYLGGAPWRAAVRTSIVKNNGIRYKSGLRLGEDILFWQMILDHTNKVAYVDKPFYHYRIVESSLSHGFKPDLLDIYREVIQSQEKYLAEGKKDIDYWNAYYFRLIIYIKQSIKYYFNNSGNDISDRYKQFSEFVRSEPYITAIHKAPLNKLVRKRSRLSILLLRFGLYRLYWSLSKA